MRASCSLDDSPDLKLSEQQLTKRDMLSRHFTITVTTLSGVMRVLR